MIIGLFRTNNDGNSEELLRIGIENGKNKIISSQSIQLEENVKNLVIIMPSGESILFTDGLLFLQGLLFHYKTVYLYAQKIQE